MNYCAPLKMIVLILKGKKSHYIIFKDYMKPLHFMPLKSLITYKRMNVCTFLKERQVIADELVKFRWSQLHFNDHRSGVASC